MQVTSSSRVWLRLQNLAFVVLFLGIIGLIGWLSTRYHLEADWTAAGRNSLSEASTEVLDRLPGAIQFTLYATDSKTLRKPVVDLIHRYQRYRDDIDLSVVNPQKNPQQTRDLGITTDGELFIGHQGRSERLINDQVNERGVTNALQRLTRSGDRYLVFLEGHGERNPRGQANHDLDGWAKQLLQKGFKVQPLSLANNPTIPDNTSVLVIASPQVDLLPGEVKIVIDYLDRGGNLLWLDDPGERHALEPLAERLGIEFLDGIIIDMNSVKLFGDDAALYALAAEYGAHPIARELDLFTLYPEAAALAIETVEGWDADPFLNTTTESWLETSSIETEAGFDQATDLPGPITFGVALTRQLPPDDIEAASADPREQRVVVLGDGDFLSNSFAGNGGNLEIGHNIINWLSHDDILIDIPVHTTGDVRLRLSDTASAIIGVVFLFALPLLLLITGGVIGWRRRRA